MNFAETNKKVIQKNIPKLKKPKSKKKAIYIAVSCLLIVSIFSYPAWAMSQKYKLVKSLQKNIANIQAASSDKKEIDPIQLTKDADNLKSQLDEKDNRELYLLSEAYNKLAYEYKSLSGQSQIYQNLGKYLETQDSLIKALDIKNALFADIESEDLERIEIDIEKRQDLKLNIERARENFEANHKSFIAANSLAGFTKEHQKLINEFYTNSIKYLATADSDTNSILNVLAAYKIVATNVNEVQVIPENTTKEQLIVILDAKGKAINAAGVSLKSIKSSDHLKTVITIYGNLVTELGNVFSDLVVSIKTGKSTINSNTFVDRMKVMQEKIKDEDTRIQQVYDNLYNTYLISKQDLGQVSFDFSKEEKLQEILTQMTDLKKRLEENEKELQDEGVLNLIF